MKQKMSPLHRCIHIICKLVAPQSWRPMHERSSDSLALRTDGCDILQQAWKARGQADRLPWL